MGPPEPGGGGLANDDTGGRLVVNVSLTGQPHSLNCCLSESLNRQTAVAALIALHVLTVPADDIASGVLLGGDVHASGFLLGEFEPSRGPVFNPLVADEKNIEPPAKHACTQVISLCKELPEQVTRKILSLVDKHPALGRVTINRSNRGIYSIYAVHTGLHKPLRRPYGKATTIATIISTWLSASGGGPFIPELSNPVAAPSGLQFISSTDAPAQNMYGIALTIEPSNNDVATPDADADANAVWVASMLVAHPELSELNAIAIDGFIYMTSTHEDTLYSIERCYQSLNLARRDLLFSIQKLGQSNTTAQAPRSGGYVDQRDHGLRMIQKSGYDDTTRKSNGRAAGPGRGGLAKSTTKPTSMERQMLDILSKKCDRLSSKLIASESQVERLEERCQRLSGVIANEAFPEPFTTDRDKGGCSASNAFPSCYFELQVIIADRSLMAKVPHTHTLCYYAM